MHPPGALGIDLCSEGMNDEVSIREMKLVREVAERRSFTLAAEAVHMSQSALSRAVNETAVPSHDPLGGTHP